MDITPYVDSLRRDLLAAAQGAGDDVRVAAERLGYALEASARLALMEAVSQAAAEITTELPAGSVDVRLAGRELDFVVSLPSAVPQPPAPPAPPTPPSGEADDDNLARITLRIPESVKARAEDLAGQAGTSLNTWLVQVVRLATREGGAGAVQIDLDLSSLPFVGRDPGGRSGRRMTGWA